MLTPEQIEEFHRFGILRIPGLIAKDAAQAMCGRVWDALESKFPVRRDNPGSWSKQRITGMNALPKSECFIELATAEVFAIADQLLGDGTWSKPQRWGSLLVTFPESAGPWDVPSYTWHFDYPASPKMRGLWAVRIFTCVAPLEHAGGATLGVAGSQRLVDKLVAKPDALRLQSAEIRKALIRAYPWFKSLSAKDDKTDRVRRFMSAPSNVDGVEVRVVELTGEPGDAWLMHPWMLHDVSTNCAATPRVVLNTTIYKSGAAQYFLPTEKTSSRESATPA